MMLQLEMKLCFKYAPFVLKHWQILENFIFGGIKSFIFFCFIGCCFTKVFALSHIISRNDHACWGT